jgi:integrase
MLSFGSYPEVSLKQARKMALEAKSLLSQGKNPASIKSKDKVITFNDVTESLLKRKVREWTEGHYRTTKSRIDNYLYSLKDKDITKITKQDIIEVLKSIQSIKLANDTKNKDKIDTTKKVFYILKQVFEEATHNDYIPINITKTIDINKIIPKSKKVEHFKAELDLKQLQSIYKLIKEYPTNTTRLALEFLILTALRPGNIRNLRWQYVDFKKQIITYPLEAIKTKEEFRLPLTNTLTNILKEMQEITKNREFVFCSPIAPSKPMSENTLNFALKRMDLDITAHGFRSSFSTICYEHQRDHGFSYEVIETQLTHKVGNQVVRAYMRSDFLKERRELLKWWEKQLYS